MEITELFIRNKYKSVTLLEEFIFSLSKTGRTKLRPLQFHGAKRNIFSKILACRNHECINSEKILKRYKLSKKRYYQILSEILAACYHDIIPNGGTALLQFLANKQLFRHFYIEMKKLEAALIQQDKKQELEQYYFRILLKRNLLFLHPKFNITVVAELDAYAHRYFKLRNNPHPHDALYLRTLQIKTCIGDPMQGFNHEVINPLITELEEIFEEVKDGNHLLAQYASSNTLMMALSQFHFDGKPSLPYAAFGLELLKKHPVIFAPIKDFYTLQCKQFLPDDEGNITELFKEYLTESGKRTGASLFYICSFLPTIIRKGEYEWAKKYIELFFPFSIDLLKKDVANHYWYILTIYNVYRGDYREGEMCLQKAFASNAGQNRNINSDVILRCYEVFFSAMHGDPLVLESIVNKEVRFAQRHDYVRGETYQVLYLKAVSDLLKYIGFDKAKAENVQEIYLRSFGVDHFSFLFQKIYNKFFS